jgi:hypothetical protein
MIELLGYGIGSILAPILSYFIFSVVLIIFILIKWRMDHDKKDKDPQVGLKVLLFYFKTVALHVMLAAAVAFAMGVFTESLTDMIPLITAMLVIGAVVYASHAVMILLFTNRSGFPSVARYFTAYNIIIAGIITMASAIMSVYFMIEGDTDSLNIAGAAVLVYSITWAVQLVILFNLPLFKKLGGK